MLASLSGHPDVGTELPGETGAGGLRAGVQYDVRRKREMAHRHLVIAIFRRVLRVSSLHVVDGLLLAVLATSLTHWLPLAPLGELVPAIVVIHLLSLNALSAYRAGDGRRDRGRVFLAVALATLTLLTLTVLPPRVPLDPAVLGIFGTLAFVTLAAGRDIVDRVVRLAYRQGIGLRKALLIGDLEEVRWALEELRDGRNIDHFIVGHVTPSATPDPTALGSIQDLTDVVELQNVQEVIVASVLPPERLQIVIKQCFEAGAALFMIPSLPRSAEYWAEPLRVGSCRLLRLHPTRLELPALLVKRSFDLIVAVLALIIWAPLTMLIAIAIKIDSKGPVFFRAKRVGLGGEFFWMWKFRSMHVNAQAREGELAHLNIYSNGTFKIPEDPRVTRVGRFLRRTSLDELPQLFNVLLGNMSLVGPRPALPGDLDRYEPHHFQRLAVIPGMTGPWQVSGRNLITDFETIVSMERSYIQGWSLLLDVKILLRTPGVVVRGEGAF